MLKFTHFDLLELTEKEQKLKMFLLEKKEEKMYSPKKETINNILNYSKALSIRKSINIDFIEIVLN
jgi:hypothetical protein